MSAPNSAGFSARLGGGVLASAERLRDQGWRDRDDKALADNRLAGLLQNVASLLRTPPETRTGVEVLIGDFAGHLRAHRPLLLTILYRPQEVLARAPALIGRTTPGFHWAALCWLAEAAWRCVDSGESTDRLILRPFAARLRFLVLSEPFRHRACAGDPWLEAGENEIYEVVFGDGTWHELLGRCRQARWTWEESLNRYQSSPLLAQAAPTELETELGMLVFRTGKAGKPLVLTGEPLTTPSRTSADDQAVAAELAIRHFLPRFQLPRVTAIALAGKPPWHLALAVLPLLAVITALTLAANGSFFRAGQTALLTYLLIGAGTVICGRMFSLPWLLRLPAAATVGLLLLITLSPTWWNKPLSGIGTPAALLAASLGYLVVEARNHGASATRAVTRALAVGTVGAVHALLVSLAGLLLIAPAYVQATDTGMRITSRLTGTHPGQSWHVLILATACCLAAGVFSQILWDDRPITAPLAHSSWSGR